MAWKEFFVYNINVPSIPAGNGSTFQDTVLRIDSDADFEFQKTAYFASQGAIRIQYRDDTAGRYLIKTSADLRSIGGNFIGTPFIWPRPYVIMAGTNFTLSTSDFSTLPNSLRLSFHGAKIRQGIAPWQKRYGAVLPFVYSTGPLSVPALSTITARIEVDNDAHFLVQKLSGSRQGAALVSVKEAAKGKDWQNTDTYFDNLIGNGQFPTVMFANRFIDRGSVVIFQIQDLSGLANTLEIQLLGVKLYEYQGTAR